MKYLKNINESEEDRYIVPLLKALSPDKLKESIDTFNDILNCMTPLLDNYKVSFSTAYGAPCFMSYDDYKEKNNKYEIFINGFPVRSYFLNITIGIDSYNIDLVSEVISGDYYEFINRMASSDSVLKHMSTDISINNPEHNRHVTNPIIIKIEFREPR